MTMYNNGKGGFQSGLADVEVTSIFDDQGKVFGNGGCNSYSATYTVDGNSIEISPVVSTRKACEQAIMEQEAAYFKALESAATFKIDGNRLQMRTAEDASAVEFVRESDAFSKPTEVARLPHPQQAKRDPLRGAATGRRRTGAEPCAEPAADGAAEFQGFRQETSTVETGTWVENADAPSPSLPSDKDGKKRVPPSVMRFQRDGTYLALVDYDKAVWGQSGLKLNLAADVARKVRSAMVSIDLAAGFPLDPTFVSVNGGGEVDARLLGNQCSGYIHRQPVVTVNWSGEADMARVFYVSDGDPTLVVLTPKGELLCNDNVHSQLLDPFVEIEKPVAGSTDLGRQRCEKPTDPGSSGPDHETRC
jgi:heat shock protein HslJ